MKKELLCLDDLTPLSKRELIYINGGENTPAQNGYEDGEAVGEKVGKFIAGLGILVLLFA